MQTIITFLFIFTVIVVFHEFGHYLAAKRAGVLVREFSIGMGPKLLDKRVGETVYTIRLLPVGGYVQLAGVDEQELPFKKGQVIWLHPQADGSVDQVKVKEPLASQDWTPLQVDDADLVDSCQITGRLKEGSDLISYPLDKTAVIYDEEGLGRQIAPRERHLQAQSVGRQFWINLAGPFNNFVLAIVVFTLFAFLNQGVISNEPVIGGFTKDSIAQTAGLKVGDRVTFVNDKPVHNWAELAGTVRTSRTDRIRLSLERKGQTKTFTVKAKPVKEGGQRVRLIGIYPSKDNRFLTKVGYGFKQTLVITVMLLQTLAGFFTRGFRLSEMGGPVAMYAMTDQVAKVGFSAVLNFMAFISVNLGVMNLLPIPALDGGKILLNLYQLVRGKPLDEKKQIYVTIVGAAFLLILMVLVTFNDIRRFF